SVSPDGLVAITLLHCFGWLSRDDLATRKGGAGPSVETPGGQERGPYRFEPRLFKPACGRGRRRSMPAAVRHQAHSSRWSRTACN
ncbi:MAG: hypothetical protein MUO35_02230, partial [Anaerolineales bacterium]|nr:hypothetical protein [Anaerolineales bacterium]